MLLAVDSNDGKSQTDLVKLTGIDRSTLADLVARLLAQGYLQRKRTKDDGRTNAIRITAVGKKMLKMAHPGADEVDRQLLSLVPSADRKSFLDTLAVLATEMDKIEEREPATRPQDQVTQAGLIAGRPFRVLPPSPFRFPHRSSSHRFRRKRPDPLEADDAVHHRR